MSLTQVRAFVRAHMDLDATDLPDLLLDAWTADSYRRIIRSTRNRPQFEVSTTLALVSGTADYAFPTVVSGSITDTLEDITNITANLQVLEWISEADLVTMLASGTTTGQPAWFNTWGRAIHLFPTPSANATATVRGRRKPRFTWLTTPTEVIDLPDDYEGPLLSWVLCEAFKQQNDTASAGNYAQDFQVKLDEINASIINMPPVTPLILNGGTAKSRRTTLLPFGF